MLELLSPARFMPHGQCYLWEPALLWIHVVSDLIIVLAYYSIPFLLAYIVKKRTDIKFDLVINLFGLFILLCGSTHLISIVTVWQPAYWLSAGIKISTALVSIFTAYFLWRLIPNLLTIPSPEQLQAVNQQLKDEIKKHEHTEKELNKFSLAIEHSPNLVIMTDKSGVIEYCNPAMCKITGYKQEELLGEKPSKLMSNLTPEDKYKNLWQTITKGQSWEGELLDRKKNGDLFWCLHTIAPIKDLKQKITHYVSVAYDISVRKDSEELIKNLAYYDPLTQLPNRSLFQERMQQAILRAKREQSIFALMYMDLDRFKSINDTLGHLTGDKLLIEVGKRIKGALREQETVARLGGDEFAIILCDIEKPESAGIVAEKLLDQFSSPIIIDHHELFVSTSVGIAIYPNDADQIESLIKEADTALYHAKDEGRGRYAFFNQTLEDKNQQQLAIEMGLRKAIENTEFSLKYQPKINTQNQQLSGVEALIRWHHPELGMVSPDAFIPIAEDTGQIDKIGDWVIQSVCLQISRWRQHHQLCLPVSINLSARQFRQDIALLAAIDRNIEHYHITPELLEFEITESAIMDAPQRSLEIMLKFQQRGLKISIDDFGTGYSSLGYLKRFPVNILKIDRSFVNDITTDKDDAAIVIATIGLAHNLGLKVIAEGVETKEQMLFLKQHHCDEIQGYYFNPPLSPEVIIEKYVSKKGFKSPILT